ncbi:nitrilase-related carbon-nitrogen hydrolase [Dankookia sp. P2]|uniref:nitrilase-related carbon-nitrogen hydrolase n=1 Tax=Dankookia sp. P2 TaxID=3423955 RepID=UPI003D679EA5
MRFESLYRHGFARIAACTIRTALADPSANAAAILEVARDCDARGTAVAAFPELALSGYSIEDLLLQDVLLDAVEAAAVTLLEASRTLRPLLVVGAPLRHAGRVYNTALVMHRGQLLGVVPKSYLPNYREFYEKRQIAPGDGAPPGDIRFAGAVALSPPPCCSRRRMCRA